MKPEDVSVVLVRSRRGANVAAACRAMKNCGVSRLVLVDPPGDLEEPASRCLAYGAWDVLDAAWQAPDLRTALADATLVAATSVRETPDVLSPRPLATRVAQEPIGRLSLVFGPEDSGLRSDELQLAHVRVRIPSHEAQPSLNLAQAVLVVCHEIFIASGETRQMAPSAELARVTAGEFEACIDHLREAWTAIGYLRPEARDTVLLELRSLLWRAGPTPREVTLLRGLARQTLWIADALARRGR